MFQSPAPNIPAAPSNVAPLPAPTQQPAHEIGSRGPEAVIGAVTVASTNAPVALTDVADDLSVQTVVAQGPGSRSSDTSARVELVMTGPRDSIFVMRLGNPPPVLVAHQFVLPIRSAHFPSGNYTIVVRLILSGRAALIASVPVHLRVT